jgi:hypothetical protein
MLVGVRAEIRTASLPKTTRKRYRLRQRPQFRSLLKSVSGTLLTPCIKRQWNCSLSAYSPPVADGLLIRVETPPARYLECRYLLKSAHRLSLFVIYCLECEGKKGNVPVHAMKPYVGIEVNLYSFVTSAEWSASRPNRFTPGKRTPVSVLWRHTRSVWFEEDKNLLPLPGYELWTVKHVT